MSHKSWKILGIALGAVCLLCVCLWYIVSSQGFMSAAANRSAELAAETLGTKIEIANIKANSWCELEIDGLAVYDKQEQLIAKAETAAVRFTPWEVFSKAPAECIDEVDIKNADVSILQRADGSWNVEDLISDTESTTKFTAKINIADSTLRSRYNNNDIMLEKVNGYVDMAAYPALSLKADCENQGARVELSATLDSKDLAAAGKAGGRQTFQLSLQDVAVEKYLPYLPTGTIPEQTIKNIAGRITKLDIAGQRIGQELVYSGQAELTDGSFILLENNKIEKARALVSFNEREAMVFVNAESNGQKASAHGKVLMNGGQPLLDLTVESQSFDPSKIMADLPYEGAVKFAAHVTGAADAPRVDAELAIPQGTFSGISFNNLTAHASYADSMVLVKDLKAGIAGGTVEVDGSFDAGSYDFVAAAELEDISAAQAGAIAADFGVNMDVSTLSGSVSGALAASGNAHTPDSLQITGSLDTRGISYMGISTAELKTSFAKHGDVVTIDYLSAILPNGGSFGAEGKIYLYKSLDLSFYGSEVDLSMIDALVPEASIAGFLDIKGTMKGDINNPVVRAKYAAHDGSIYHQPYDSLHGSAAGNLKGVKIDDFVMSSGEKTKWYAKGVLGFLGDKYIDMRVDTVAARMEDIMQAVAPEQKLTGNVDNVITITGTLTNPNIVGYVHFYQGSYNGIFINGMDGDYYVENNAIRLQDFHVFTPWVDVDFNGTIDEASNIKLAAKVHEIDLSRYNKLLPIPLSGKAQFSGNLTGTLNHPFFEGQLSAQDMTVNGQAVKGVSGIVQYSEKFIFFKDINFTQSEGKYTFDGRVNLQTKGLHGKLKVDKGDIHSIVAMGGLPDNGITGTLSGESSFGGTLERPQVSVSAQVTDGFLGAYPLNNVIINAGLDGRRLYVDNFSGNEGSAGSFKAAGTVDLDGAVDMNVSLQAIDAGALTEAAGIKTQVAGTLNTEVHIGGTFDNPQAVIPVSVQNLQVQSTLLDRVEGILKLADKAVEIQQLTAAKTYNQNTYSLNASGKIPLAALTDEMPTESNQFDVNFALDNADLSLLPTVSEYIDWAIGPTEGQMHLQGTAQRPYLTGSLNVADGAMKLKGVVKPVTGMNLRVLFNGNTFTMEQCTGMMGSGGFNAVGFVHLDGNTPDDYNLDVNFDNLDVDSTVFKGGLNATINVQDKEIPSPDGGAQKIPLVSGRLFLENVLISLPHELPTSSDGLPLVALDYAVELGKNVRFLSPSLGDLRLAGGAYFGGTTLYPNTSGSIFVTRGNLSYLKTNFKVYEGAINFGQVGTLLPNVVLKAGTKINKTNVFLSLTGPIANMQFRLMSNPKMAEADIIQLLTLRSEYYNHDRSDTSKFISALNIGLQMTILSEVEEAMRNVLNLDVFAIERDTLTSRDYHADGTEKNGDKKDYEVYNITLGKNISDKVLVKYSQSMTTSDFSYGLDYEISDKFTLSYKRNQDNDYYAGIEARITF